MGETSRPADGDGSGVDWFGLPSADLVRALAGLLLAALAAVVGAFILGEYQFTGWLPPVAGVLFGLVDAEIAVEVGRRRSVPIGVACAAFAAGGVLWAGWISAGEGLEPIATGAWVAAGLAFAAALARVVGPRRPT